MPVSVLRNSRIKNSSNIIDGDCYSIAIGTIKCSFGLITLVSRNIERIAVAYLLLSVMTLPVGDMKFRAEAKSVINPKGSFNELFGISPDIELPRRITKEELLKDEWIRTVIDK